MNTLTITDIGQIFWRDSNNLPHNKYGFSDYIIWSLSKFFRWRYHGVPYSINGGPTDVGPGTQKIWQTRINDTFVLHRLNGPALETTIGINIWAIEGVEYSYLEYLIAIDQYNQLLKKHR